MLYIMCGNEYRRTDYEMGVKWQDGCEAKFKKNKNAYDELIDKKR